LWRGKWIENWIIDYGSGWVGVEGLAEGC